MIKTYLYKHDNKEIENHFDLTQVNNHLTNAKDLLWIDIYDYQYNELNEIAELFKFHPLAIEDCVHEDSRPKMDNYGDYKFFVFHAPIYNEKSEIEISTVELNIFVGSNYIVTVHKQKLKWLGQMEALSLGNPSLMNKGADLLLHTFIDGITDEYFPVLDRIRTRIDELEDEMYDHKPKKVTEEFLALKRAIILIRQGIMPQKRIFSNVNGKWQFEIHEENIPFYKDLNDHLEQIVESTETYRELVNSALDTYYSIISAKSIEKLNLLTVISTIMLPLSVITGFFGMNVPLPFQDTPFATVVIFVFLIAFTWGMWVFFKKIIS